MKSAMPHEIDTKDDIFNKEIIETFFSKAHPKVPAEKIGGPPPKYKDASKKQSAVILTLSLALVVVISSASFIVWQTHIHEKNTSGAHHDNTYLKVLENGVFNRAVLRSFSFKGDAKERSVVLRNHIKLVNDGNLGWARATCDLTEPQDFSNSNLLILARSEQAERTILLVLIDLYGKGYLIPLKLSPKWEWKSVSLENVYDLDLKNVKSVSIEYGSLTAKNAKGTIVYIKEIGLRSTK